MESVREKAGGMMQLSVSTSYKLRVQQNQGPNNPWFEQNLTRHLPPGTIDALFPLSIQVDDTIGELFNQALPGDKFNCQIVVKRDYPDLPSLPSYEKSYPDTPYVYAPKQ